MGTDNHSWAMKQVDAKYPSSDSPSRQTLIALMSVWTRMQQMHGDSLDEITVVDDFRKLCHSENLIPLEVVNDESSVVWGPASQFHAYNDMARTRVDLKSGDDAWKLNGRTGVIVGKRNGYFIIEFNDALDGAPIQYRGRPDDFEIDITHLSSYTA